MKGFTTGLGLAIVFIVTPLFSQEHSQSLANLDVLRALNREQIKPFADVLNEVSERRRINSFFPNPQSPFDGVQIGHVNTTAGNLTFMRRDLVRLSRFPIVFSRIHDSRLAGDHGFGPGWQSSFSESITVDQSGYIYHQANGNSVHFVDTDHGLSHQHPQHDDILNIDHRGDGTIEVTYTNLWVKRFESVASQAEQQNLESETKPNAEVRYVLVEVINNNGQRMRLEYDKGQLARISNDYHALTLIWSATGSRVSAIQDDLGRTVQYRYDRQGRLSQVSDVGGNEWSYHYDGQDRLKKVIDPNRHQALVASYVRDGQVQHARIRAASYHFQYRDGHTTVRDELRQQTDYQYNSEGLTTQVVNAEGFKSQVRYDDKNRVSAVLQNQQMVAEFRYGTDDRLQRMTRYDLTGSVIMQYQYNWHDGVITASGSNGKNLTLRYDDNGNLTERTIGLDTSRYRYDALGDLKSVEDGSRKLVFERNALGMMSSVKENDLEPVHLSYNALGRVASLRFDDLVSIEYAYDDLGFRNHANFNGPSENFYEFDPAGNLIQIRFVRDGEIVIYDFEIDDRHLLRKSTSNTGSVQYYHYNAAGQLIRLVDGDEVTRFSYDALNRLLDVETAGSTLAEYAYRASESDITAQLDDRTQRSVQSGFGASGIYGSLGDIAYLRNKDPIYGVTQYVADSSAFDLVSSWAVSLPDETILKSLQRAKISFTGENRADLMRFNTASNSMFLPPEYQSMNCFPCNGESCEPEPTYCLGIIDAVSISGPSTAIEDTDVNFSASITSGACAIPQYDWTFSDGGSAFGQSVGYTFANPGVYSVVLSATCPCDVIFPAVNTARTIAISAAPPPPPGCDVIGRDVVAKEYLQSRPARQPYEEGVIIECSGNIASTGATFQGPNINLPTAERCEIPQSIVTAAQTNSNAVGLGHTHPFFDEDDVGKSITCHNELFVILSAGQADQINENNNSFSANDLNAGNSFANLSGRPISPIAVELYLRRSTQNTVYKYNNGNNGATGVIVQ